MELKELEEHIKSLVHEQRLWGNNPKYLIIDYDTEYKLSRSRDFIPAFMKRDVRDGDTIYGLRIAVVKPNIIRDFIEVL